MRTPPRTAQDPRGRTRSNRTGAETEGARRARGERAPNPTGLVEPSTTTTRGHRVHRALWMGWILTVAVAVRPARGTEPWSCDETKKLHDVAITVLKDGKEIANTGFVDCVSRQFNRLATDARAEYLKEASAALAKIDAKIAATTANVEKATATTKQETDAAKRNASTLEQKGGTQDLNTYQQMEGFLFALLQGSDPTELNLDFYLETRYSSLYNKDGSGTLGTSHPAFILELRQLLAVPRPVPWHRQNVETYGYIAFRDSPTDATTATGAITTAGLITFEGGVVWRPLRFATEGRLSLGAVGGIGLDWFSQKTENPPEGIASQVPAHAKTRYRLGLQLRQEAGLYEGTYCEAAYLRDPVFTQADRLLIRGRLVVSPKLSSASTRGLGVYLEGLGNIGSGRDEIALDVGVRLDAIAVLRAIVGLAK